MRPGSQNWCRSAIGASPPSRSIAGPRALAYANQAEQDHAALKAVRAGIIDVELEPQDRDSSSPTRDLNRAV
jgi:hypothetical protein